MFYKIIVCDWQDFFSTDSISPIAAPPFYVPRKIYVLYAGVAFLSTKPQDVWVNVLCWVSVKTQKGLYNNGQRTYFLLFLLQNKVYKLDKARMLEIIFIFGVYN